VFLNWEVARGAQHREIAEDGSQGQQRAWPLSSGLVRRRLLASTTDTVVRNHVLGDGTSFQCASPQTRDRARQGLQTGACGLGGRPNRVCCSNDVRLVTSDYYLLSAVRHMVISSYPVPAARFKSPSVHQKCRMSSRSGQRTDQQIVSCTLGAPEFGCGPRDNASSNQALATCAQAEQMKRQHISNGQRRCVHRFAYPRQQRSVANSCGDDDVTRPCGPTAAKSASAPRAGSNSKLPTWAT
jgi:hypothetical protein